ncbi:MAG: TVP38/TMEM64 family protein [Anaerolineae bacterium]|jgi:uncharacterized membrane protein YdjX (TVP38/TMEM64 family)|nr:TVP38/TMEM64 family protein [Chloroflexota bacterium]
MEQLKKFWPLLLGAAALVALALWIRTSGVLDRFGDWNALATMTEEVGGWMIVFLLAAQVVQVLVPVIPSQLLGMAAGFLYGIVGGTFVSWFGTALGGILAIALARRYGRPFVEKHASPETIDEIDAIARRFGSWGFFLVALIPFMPTDIGCFVAGLTALRMRSTIIPISLGRVPGLLVLSYLGATSKEISLEAMVLISAFTLIVAGILWHYRERLEGLGHRVMQRLKLY